jgi:hypothetical protein
MILKLGTDGSFHQEKETASFGWVLLGNQTLLVRGAGPVDGVPSMMSSTRAELFGIASPNEFLYHFDNKAAISRVHRTQNNHSRRRRYSNDVDVLTVIVDWMKESTLRH